MSKDFENDESLMGNDMSENGFVPNENEFIPDEDQEAIISLDSDIIETDDIDKAIGMQARTMPGVQKDKRENDGNKKWVKYGLIGVGAVLIALLLYSCAGGFKTNKEPDPTEPSIEMTNPTDPVELPSNDPTKPTEDIPVISGDDVDPTEKPTEPVETPTDPEKPTDPTKPTNPSKPAHTHDYMKTIVKPTCTAGGHTVYRCECGHSYKDDATAATGHKYAEVLTKPTCTENGYTTYTCTNCDNSYRSDYTKKLGHDYVSTVVEPTYEAGGYTEHKCSRCGDTYKNNYTDKLIEEHTHEYVKTVVKPTCTKAGYTKNVCECGHEYNTDKVDAIGHKYVDKVVAPTCTVGGYTEHKCERCEDSYITDKTSAQHTYVTSRVEPTCESKGKINYFCSICGDEKEDLIDVLGHDYEVTSTVEVSCEADGYTEYTCKREGCGHVYKDNIIEAIGHQVVGEYKDATCTEDGYNRTKCERGCFDNNEVVPALGHDYKETVVEATCQNTGYTLHECQREGCNDSYTDNETPIAEHNIKDTVIAPTIKEQGYTKHECITEGCDYETKDNYTDVEWVITSLGMDMDHNSDFCSKILTNENDVHKEKFNEMFKHYDCYETGDDRIIVKAGDFEMKFRWSQVEVVEEGEGFKTIKLISDYITRGHSVSGVGFIEIKDLKLPESCTSCGEALPGTLAIENNCLTYTIKLPIRQHIISYVIDGITLAGFESDLAPVLEQYRVNDFILTHENCNQFYGSALAGNIAKYDDYEDKAGLILPYWDFEATEVVSESVDKIALKFKTESFNYPNDADFDVSKVTVAEKCHTCGEKLGKVTVEGDVVCYEVSFDKAPYDNRMVDGTMFNYLVGNIDGIEAIKFTNIAAPKDVETTDLSKVSDKSILGWLDGSTYYVSAVSGEKIIAPENCSEMFYSINKFGDLKSIDLSNLDTSNTTNMSLMFYNCNDIKKLDLSGFNTENVITMRSMFFGTDKLEELDISKFDTKNVTDMYGMFHMSGLEELDLSHFKTDKVTNMAYMFQACGNMITLNLKGWDVSKVEDMTHMFYDCQKLVTIKASDWTKEAKAIKNHDSMFTYDKSLVGAIKFTGVGHGTDIAYANTVTGFFESSLVYKIESLTLGTGSDVKKMLKEDVKDFTLDHSDCVDSGMGVVIAGYAGDEEISAIAMPFDPEYKIVDMTGNKLKIQFATEELPEIMKNRPVSVASKCSCCGKAIDGLSVKNNKIIFEMTVELNEVTYSVTLATVSDGDNIEELVGRNLDDNADVPHGSCGYIPVNSWINFTLSKYVNGESSGSYSYNLDKNAVEIVEEKDGYITVKFKSVEMTSHAGQNITISNACGTCGEPLENITIEDNRIVITTTFKLAE